MNPEKSKTSNYTDLKWQSRKPIFLGFRVRHIAWEPSVRPLEIQTPFRPLARNRTSKSYKLPASRYKCFSHKLAAVGQDFQAQGQIRACEQGEA